MSGDPIEPGTLRRRTRRMPLKREPMEITDEVDVGADDLAVLALVFTLDHALDIVRLNALFASGHEEVRRWRARLVVLRRIRDAIVDDLANGDGARIDRLDRNPRLWRHEPEE